MSKTETIAEQIGLGDKYKKKDKNKKKEEEGILKYFKKKITEAMS